MAFAVVDMWEGLDRDSSDALWTEVIPMNWIYGDICFFPPFKGTKIGQAVAKKVQPDKTKWLQYSVSIHGVYDSIIKARQKCRKVVDEKMDSTPSEMSSQENNGSTGPLQSRKSKRTKSAPLIYSPSHNSYGASEEPISNKQQKEHSDQDATEKLSSIPQRMRPASASVAIRQNDSSSEDDDKNTNAECSSNESDVFDTLLDAPPVPGTLRQMAPISKETGGNSPTANNHRGNTEESSRTVSKQTCSSVSISTSQSPPIAFQRTASRHGNDDEDDVTSPCVRRERMRYTGGAQFNHLTQQLSRERGKSLRDVPSCSKTARKERAKNHNTLDIVRFSSSPTAISHRENTEDSRRTVNKQTSSSVSISTSHSPSNAFHRTAFRHGDDDDDDITSPCVRREGMRCRGGAQFTHLTQQLSRERGKSLRDGPSCSKTASKERAKNHNTLEIVRFSSSPTAINHLNITGKDDERGFLGVETLDTQEKSSSLLRTTKRGGPSLDLLIQGQREIMLYMKKQDTRLDVVEQRIRVGKQLKEDSLKKELDGIPLGNLDALRSLERNLRKDEGESKELLKSTIVLTGGNSIRDAIYRSWAKLVSNDLASQLNWKGAARSDRPKKVGVERLIFTKEIKNGIRLIPGCGGLTDKIFEDSTKDWLRHAPERRRAELRRLTTPRDVGIADGEDNDDVGF